MMHLMTKRSAFGVQRSAFSVRRSTFSVQRSTLNVRRSSRSSAFTLVELLVVLMIIGILAGMGITAMQHIGRSTALSSGVRQFANSINMARNYAIVNSTYLYLVVATKDTITNSTDYAYTAYGFCTPVPTSSITAARDTIKVVYVEEIQYLPKGVVFDNGGTNNVVQQNVSFPAPGGGTNLWTTWAWVVEFTPNGQMFPLYKRPTFTLYEGVVNAATYLPMRTGVSTNGYRIEINPLIGKPIVTKFP